MYACFNYAFETLKFSESPFQKQPTLTMYMSAFPVNIKIMLFIV